MRNALSKALVAQAKINSKLLLLTGDHGYSLFDEFIKECPTQYINAGIAEQNMVGMAAGLAKAGFFPVVYGLSAFIPIRVLEQIKLDVCHDNLPVVFLGDGAGFVYSSLGTSHQSTEDIAATRAIPNLRIYSPCDKFEISWCIKDSIQSGFPSYIRIGKSDVDTIHQDHLKIDAGDLINISKSSSKKYVYLATGSMVATAKQVAGGGIVDGEVWSVPTIKPINAKQVISICESAEKVVVLEEHSIYGGLGSLVSEITATHHPKRVLRIGVRDRFSMYCGSYEYLKMEHGLDVDSVTKAISKFL
jgi:transketolase